MGASDERIVGSGMIAGSFKQCVNALPRDFKILAFGVSNSGKIHEIEYSRERDRIEQELSGLNTSEKVIYFSSLLVGANLDVDYYKHKKNMERFIADRSTQSYIFRLPQVVGQSGSAHTLVTYFVNKFLQNEAVIIQRNAKRFLLDVDDLVKVVVDTIKSSSISKEHNQSVYAVLPCESIDVIEIVFLIQDILGIKVPIEFTDEAMQYNERELTKNIKKISVGNAGYNENVLRTKVPLIASRLEASLA